MSFLVLCSFGQQGKVNMCVRIFHVVLMLSWIQFESLLCQAFTSWSVCRLCLWPPELFVAVENKVKLKNININNNNNINNDDDGMLPKKA